MTNSPISITMYIVNILLDPFLLIVFLLIVIYYYFTATFDFWSKRGVPCKKPTIILGNFGDLLLFRKSQPEGISDMYNWFRESRFFGVYRVRSPILIIRDPELVKHVCIKDFACFTNRGIPTNSEDTLSRNLFNLEGKAWKGLRCKLTPAFTSGKIRRMFYLLIECHEELRKLIVAKCHDDEKRIIDVREFASKFTIDVIGSCAFGIRMNALTGDDSNAFRRMAVKLSKPSYKTTLWRMLRTAIPRLYRLLGVRVIDPKVTEFFKDAVSQMIAQRETEIGPKRHDFMDLLIQLKNEDKLDIDNGGNHGGNGNGENLDTREIELSDNAIAAQAFVFFVAGNETSSNTIAFCLYELSLNKTIQDRARREINDEIERTNGKLTYEGVQEMKYLDMIVWETLRKYPPAPMLSRRCEYPYLIPGTDVELPVGMRVVIPIYGIHHDPDYYPEPETFDPERFNDVNKSKRIPHTYLPFGEGPRNCIGTRFALLQTKIGIISFLRDHQVEACEKTVVPIKFSRRSLVTSSEGGFWLKINSLI